MVEGVVHPGEGGILQSLGDFVLANKERLARPSLSYLQEHGASANEVPGDLWRDSIHSLSEALCRAFRDAATPGAFVGDAAGEYGKSEAVKHRLAGTSPEDFLGVLKQARGTLIGLAAESQMNPADPDVPRTRLLQFFDRAELAFCAGWAREERGTEACELRALNRQLSNEKNRYLTVFESLANPVILFDSKNEVIGMNYAAAELFATDDGVGTHGRGEPDSRWIPEWMSDALHDFAAGTDVEAVSEHSTLTAAGTRYFEMHLTRALDVGDRVEGTTAELTEITARKRSEEAKSRLIDELQEALAKVKTLSGLLPICARCKQIRDDQGYWNSLETYIQEHSSASFSHGICPECACEFETSCGVSDTG